MGAVVLAGLALVGGACSRDRQAVPPIPEQPRREDIIHEALGAVVSITAKHADGSEDRGSGFFVDPAGLIVTNRHVVAGAKSILITLPTGEELQPIGFFGAESVDDLAVLLVDHAIPKAIELRRDLPRPGEDVLALGHPLGLANTVTEGIVSSVRETETGAKMIQTSAAISAGNSGGPLIDRNGRAIGVVTWKVAAQAVEGLAFATSAEAVLTILDNRGAALSASDFQNAVRDSGKADRRARSSAAVGSFVDRPEAMHGTWKPGSSDRTFISLKQDGPNRLIGSFVVLDGPIVAEGDRISEYGPISLRRDFLVVRDRGAWRGSFARPWTCTASRVVQRRDGTYALGSDKECWVPTEIEFVGVHGRLLRVTVREPTPPPPASSQYARACDGCLQGFPIQASQADFERIALEVTW